MSAPILLITGGSRGIGAATARLAAQRGFDVAFTYVRDGAAAERVTAEIQAAGRRALRNVLLDYVTVASSSPEAAAAQYRDAGNMTERAAALSVLVQRQGATKEAAAALTDFDGRFSNDPLVLDKWFQIQATAPGAEAVDTVRRLMRHRGFQPTNPNRVRSLVGTFSMANQTGFHRADGGGYELLAEVVLSVESKNPQLAARLATAFRSWRSLEPGRREHVRETLTRMKSRPGLSTDVADIVERSLA